MRIKIFVLILLILAAAVVGIFKITSGKQLTQQQISELEDKERRRSITLEERAHLAKVRGNSKIYLPAVASLYMEAESPEELRQRLPDYTVVIAELVGRKTYIRDGGIRTWYKFKTIDTVYQTPPLTFLAPTRDSIHTELLPIKENEFVINRPGGSLMIDGVEFIQNEQNVLAFAETQRYILLLSFDQSSKIGEIILGGQSILPVNYDNTFDSKQTQHMLQRVITEHYGGSLGQLKRTLQ